MKVEISNDNTVWTAVDGGHDFPTNLEYYDRDTIKEVIFNAAVSARYFKLKPTTWNIDSNREERIDGYWTSDGFWIPGYWTSYDIAIRVGLL